MKEHFNTVEDIKTKDDSQIRIAMLEVSDWKKRKQDICKSYRKYNNLVDRLDKALTAEIGLESGRKDAESELDSLKADRDDLEVKFDDMETFADGCLKEIRVQDTSRSLHSKDTDKPTDVEWPRFAGKDNEDFTKFKEKLERAFKLAKVSRDLKVDKLRSLLSGHAKDLVPDTVSDLEEAFKLLDGAFGDPSRLVDYKLKVLGDIGQLPNSDRKGGYRNQVSFYIKLQGIVEDLVSLGSQSEDLAVLAFHRSTSHTLANRFPSSLRNKLILKHSKLKGKEQLVAMLDTIKKWREEAQVLDSTETGTGSNSKGSSTQAPTTRDNKGARDIKANVVSPYRFDDCLICKHLEQKGGQTDLFVNHVGKFPTGCPKFLGVSQQEKFSIIKKLNMCITCLNPSSIEKPARHRPCKVKHPFYCRSDKGCRAHIILCNKHQTENRPFLQKYSEIVAEKGITFHIGIACTTPITSLNMATHSAKNVRKLNVGLDKNSTLLPVPSGNPMFMFCTVAGKSRDVNIMVDCGCSHACFKHGAVIHQLNGFCTARGEFPVNVAGGSQITAKGEWMVSLKKRSGDYQAVVGLAVDQVTVDFPRVSLKGAVAAIKSDVVNNRRVQECVVPEIAGGSVDILLGIQYASLFPKLIHMLPCGLGIYELELEAPRGEFNACIAGPHETLAALSLKAGGTQTLLAHFMQGLEQWRTVASAAPLLYDLPPTEEELDFNHRINCMEDETGLVNSLYCEEERFRSLKTEDDHICNHHHLHSVIDDKLSMLKKNIPAEVPLDIEYRCIKCRNCSKCQDSDNQEKISLREEAELEQCRDSVMLDYDNRRILCSLPLRGKEEHFLGPNRDMALKILEQQVKKYSENREVKEMIVKAFNKMFNNGHIKMLKDLTEIERSSFLNKQVQNYIPWRICFSGSASTPACPVFDASTRTHKNPNNSGGRCYNDLTC